MQRNVLVRLLPYKGNISVPFLREMFCHSSENCDFGPHELHLHPDGTWVALDLPSLSFSTWHSLPCSGTEFSPYWGLEMAAKFEVYLLFLKFLSVGTCLVRVPVALFMSELRVSFFYFLVITPILYFTCMFAVLLWISL